MSKQDVPVDFTKCLVILFSKKYFVRINFEKFNLFPHFSKKCKFMDI